MAKIHELWPQYIYYGQNTCEGQSAGNHVLCFRVQNSFAELVTSSKKINSGSIRTLLLLGTRCMCFWKAQFEWVSKVTRYHKDVHLFRVSTFANSLHFNFPSFPTTYDDFNLWTFNFDKSEAIPRRPLPQRANHESLSLDYNVLWYWHVCCKNVTQTQKVISSLAESHGRKPSTINAMKLYNLCLLRRPIHNKTQIVQNAIEN